MKKNILLICDCGLQFGVVVDEMSVSKVVKQLKNDIYVTPKPCLDFADYAPNKDPNQTMIVKTGPVVAIRVIDVNSNVQVPNKKLFMPGAGIN